MAVHTQDRSKLWFNTSVVEYWAHEMTSWEQWLEWMGSGVEGGRGWLHGWVGWRELQF